MTNADIAAGMRLKELAGWNQTVADWERFLVASPEGCFVAEADGRVCGTVTTIIYEDRFAWIGMVLVDPEYRGRGIGTLLLEKAIEYLDRLKAPAIKLDATPQGKPLYTKLGFGAEYEIERWVLKRPPENPSTPPTLDRGNAAARPDFEAMMKLDRQVFGADRSTLLGSLDRDAPEFTLAINTNNELVGYALGRHGSRADHLGPWIARDEASARRLLVEFMRRSTREHIFVDCLKSSPFACGLVRDKGFEFSRPLTRMYRGANRYPGRPELVAAIVGPEFG
ncbi:MAG TPA: GNAT family N-acetyltransferase [Terriglobia bacterium]|nr:GNAT family N-acetyltransferase [Terriglobia bacterium]